MSNNCYRLRRLGFARRAALDCGQLGLYATVSARRAHAAEAFARTIVGAGQRPAAFEEACGERCEIGTDVGAVLATLDGEVVVLASPLDFRCRRAALPVMVSASGRDA